MSNNLTEKESELIKDKNRKSMSSLMLLTLIFASLKTFEVIDWEWLWVFSPLWIPFALLFLIVFFAIIFGFFKAFFKTLF